MAAEVLERNRLGDCTSPYLLQHAHNPVAWQPWDDTALAAAPELDRPILLSIGYSACHWCHVMAHESFEDPDVAELMNRLFVPIKVDREERPDLDQIYQLAFQLMNRRGGGWPLTAFLTPDQRPFFIATYFPREPKFGMPGFPEVLEQVAEFYQDHRESAIQNGDAVIEGLRQVAPSGSRDLDRQVVARLAEDLERAYDGANAGWGSAPKFPHTAEIAFCLSRQALDGDHQAGQRALASLRAMTDGGLNDHLGGGFFRYCVDADWTIPHFEKMLYDNAGLLGVLAEGYTHSGDDALRVAAAETLDWLEREMRHPEGAFYATLDADSEGVEGGYYIWAYDEIAALLEPLELQVVERVYGLSRNGNFEGKNHLQRVRELAEVADELGLQVHEVAEALEGARAKLFAARTERPFVGRDEKILTGWNGLLVDGLARAGAAFDEARYLDRAQEIVDFIRDRAWKRDRLLAVLKDGRGQQPGFLEDHAYLLKGLMALLQVRWRDPDLAFAQELAEALLAHFEDPEEGGFFMTADDQEALIHRPKPGMDQSVPSGNGSAAQALLDLGHLLGEPRYLESAERALRLFMPEIRAHPGACVSLILALEEALSPPTVVTLRGGTEAQEWQQLAAPLAHPERKVYHIPDDADLPGPLAARTSRGGATAYLCRGTTCTAPITDRRELERALAEPPQNT